MSKREVSPEQLAKLEQARRKSEEAETQFAQTLQQANILFLGISGETASETNEEVLPPTQPRSTTDQE